MSGRKRTSEADGRREGGREPVSRQWLERCWSFVCGLGRAQIADALGRDEVVEAAWERFLLQVARGRVPRHPRAYLRKLFGQAVVRWRTRPQVVPFSAVTEAAEAPFGQPVRRPVGRRLMRLRGALAALDRRLGPKLTRRQREAVRLRLMNHSFAEIGQALGTTPSAARRLCLRGVARSRELLGRKGGCRPA